MDPRALSCLKIIPSRVLLAFLPPFRGSKMSKYSRVYRVYKLPFPRFCLKTSEKLLFFLKCRKCRDIFLLGVSDMTDIELFYSKNLRKSLLGCPKCPNKSPARNRVKKLCARIVSLNYFLAVGSLLNSLASLSVRGSLGVYFSVLPLWLNSFLTAFSWLSLGFTRIFPLYSQITRIFKDARLFV